MENEENIESKRMDLFRDALIGIPCWLSDPAAFVYPVVDLLHLFCLEPTCIYFKDRQSGSCVFGVDIRGDGDSFKKQAGCCTPVPGIDHEGNVNELGGQFDLCVCCCQTCPSHGHTDLRNPIQDLFDVKAFTLSSTHKAFIVALNRSLTHYKDSGSKHVAAVSMSIEEPEILEVLTDCCADPLLEPVRRLMDATFKMAIAGQLVDENRGTAIFPLLRHVTSEERSGMSLLFLPGEEMEEALETRCQKFGTSLQKLQPRLQELFKNAARGSWQGICHGFTELYPLRGRDAQIAEEVCLLTSQHDGSVPDTLMLVPVHVEGVPWIVFAQFLVLRKQDDWFKSFYFYRDLLPCVATHVRTGAKQTFLEVVESQIVAELELHEEPSVLLWDGINARLETVSRHFPFQQIEMQSKQDFSVQRNVREYRLSLPGQEKITLLLKPNSHVSHDLKFDPIEDMAIKRVCNTTLTEYMTLWEKGRGKGREEGLHEYFHTIKAKLGIIELYLPTLRGNKPITIKEEIEYKQGVGWLRQIKDEVMVFSLKEAGNEPQWEYLSAEKFGCLLAHECENLRMLSNRLQSNLAIDIDENVNGILRPVRCVFDLCTAVLFEIFWNIINHAASKSRVKIKGRLLNNDVFALIVQNTAKSNAFARINRGEVENSREVPRVKGLGMIESVEAYLGLPLWTLSIISEQEQVVEFCYPVAFIEKNNGDFPDEK